MKRILVTLALALGLLLAPVAAPASATTGHWCAYSALHQWSSAGNTYRTFFARHDDVYVGGAQVIRRDHLNYVEKISGGQWRYHFTDRVTNCH